MRLSRQADLFALGGVPLVGNVETGGVIGLTREGDALCHALAERDVSPEEVPAGCAELVEHLRRGGYLAAGGGAGTGRPAAAPRVSSAYLHVTQRCNLRCRLCYSEGDDRNALPDPTLDELLRAIDLLAALGTSQLVVSGGEPFLRPDLGALAGHARAAGIDEVVVLTNGLLVTDRSLEPLTGSVGCVAVAFDGASARARAHLRGAQRFDRLVEAVAAVRRAGIEARVLPTLHARNLADREAYRALAARLGASIGFSLLTAPAEELGELALTDDQLRELGSSSLDEGLPGGDAPAPPGVRLAARRSCSAGARRLSVAADGTVYPCHMLHRRELAMGDAFAEGDATARAEALLGGPVARAFRELDVRTFETCRDCDARLLCGGGCRARALMDAGRLDARDPACALQRSYFDSLGTWLARRFAREGGDRHAV